MSSTDAADGIESGGLDPIQATKARFSGVAAKLQQLSQRSTDPANVAEYEATLQETLEPLRRALGFDSHMALSEAITASANKISQTLVREIEQRRKDRNARYIPETESRLLAGFMRRVESGNIRIVNALDADGKIIPQVTPVKIVTDLISQKDELEIEASASNNDQTPKEDKVGEVETKPKPTLEIILGRIQPAFKVTAGNFNSYFGQRKFKENYRGVVDYVITSLEKQGETTAIVEECSQLIFGSSGTLRNIGSAGFPPRETHALFATFLEDTVAFYRARQSTAVLGENEGADLVDVGDAEKVEAALKLTLASTSQKLKESYNILGLEGEYIEGIRESVTTLERVGISVAAVSLEVFYLRPLIGKLAKSKNFPSPGVHEKYTGFRYCPAGLKRPLKAA